MENNFNNNNKINLCNRVFKDRTFCMIVFFYFVIKKEILERYLNSSDLLGIGVAKLSADCASLDLVRTVTACGLIPTSFVMSISA